MNQIEEAITEHWGARCPDSEPGCPICDAWEVYDSMLSWGDQYRGLVTRYDEAIERIHNLTAELEYLRLEVNRG